MTFLSALLMGAGLALGNPGDFQPPTRLKADGVPIRVESPGYACPCWADIDGDGKKDLLVGQFSGGKIRVYKNLGDGKLGAGDWLKADGAAAEIPGVW
jgi:FG-GAP-like repeat